jgi:hypothetical protein
MRANASHFPKLSLSQVFGYETEASENKDCRTVKAKSAGIDEVKISLNAMLPVAGCLQ